MRLVENTLLSVYMVLYESQCDFHDTFHDTSTYTHMHTGMHACNGTCSFPFSVTTTMCTCAYYTSHRLITCMSCTQLNQLRHSHVLQSAKILKQSFCYPIYPYTPSSVSQTMQPVKNTNITHLHQKSQTSYLPVM